MKQNRQPRPQPSDTGKLIAEARDLFASGQVGKAEDLLNAALNLNPGDLSAILALGIIAAETGQLNVAEERFARALSVDPKCVPALCWMSFVMLKADRPTAAVEYAALAVRLDSANPATHAALGRGLNRQGMSREAIPALQNAARLDPNNAVVLYDLADALMAVGRSREVADVLRRAVMQAPEPLAILKLAYLEMRFGRIEEAERLARRVIRKDPRLASAHVILARALTEQLKGEEAEVHWLAARELDPHSAQITLEKALALTAAGDFEKALKELENAIEANPLQGAAYQAFAFTKRVSEDDQPMIRKMEAALRSDALADEERSALLFALGKSYDNLGKYEQAIRFFDEGNALKWSALGAPDLDESSLAATVDAKIMLYSKSILGEAPRMGIPSSLPIAVVGMMRSGTTFVEQMLTCHPEIGGAGEQLYWADHDEAIVDYARQTIDRGKLRTCGTEYVQILSSVAPGYAHVVDKNPANLLVAGSMHLALPNARIVHVRRNPVDTALSIWMTPIDSTAEFVANKANIVTALRQFRRLAAHWRAVMPADRFLEIRYEDLVDDPEKFGRELVEFLGLEWNEACLHPELNKRRVVTPSLWQVRQPIYRTSAERWKRYEPWLGEFRELLDWE